MSRDASWCRSGHDNVYASDMSGTSSASFLSRFTPLHALDASARAGGELSATVWATEDEGRSRKRDSSSGRVGAGAGAEDEKERRLGVAEWPAGARV